MYFVLDVSNFLHCKDDLLQSFCNVFSIPSAFYQQIYGLWLLDHELVTVRCFQYHHTNCIVSYYVGLNQLSSEHFYSQNSMNILLSPRACPPTLSWHHCAVLKTLLKTGENQAALKYLYSITPAMENIQDIKLCVDVLIHNK